MKKLLFGILSLCLLTIGAVYLVACAKTAGPLSPSYSPLTAKTPLTQQLPLVSSITGALTYVTSTVQVVFNLPMDPNTINSSTVQVYALDQIDPYSLETRFLNFTITLVNNGRVLELTPNAGGWPNTGAPYTGAYRVVLSNSIANQVGRPLDGNGNQNIESSEVDNWEGYFTVGAPLAAYTPRRRFNVSSTTYSSDGASSPFAFGGGIGNLSTTYSGAGGGPNYVTLYVTFADALSAARTQLDLNSIITDPQHFMSTAVILTDGNGNAVNPANVTATSSGIGPFDRLQIELQLTAGTQYKFGLKGGVNGIKLQYGGVPLSHQAYFDGNNNTYMEPIDDTTLLTLQTRPTTDNTVLTSTISFNSVSYDATLRRATVIFNVPSGTGMLDPASAILQNFQCVNNISPFDAVAVERLELDNVPATPRVYLYFPRHCRGVTGAFTCRLTISRNVRSSTGVRFDGNGNNVTGEVADDYPTTFVVTGF